MYCLPPAFANIFLGKLKAGEIKPDELAEMSSDERRAFFNEFMGETHAKNVNYMFESKLLLKDQQRGLINWAKGLSGLKPEVKSDIISKINNMTEVLNPKNKEMFLEDLVAHKLGVTVSLDEASKISGLAKAVSENREVAEKVILREGFDLSKESTLDRETRLEYGRSLVKFSNYIGSLKAEAKKPTIEEAKAVPGQTALKMAIDIAGIAKSLKASLDDSVVGRQGLKTMFAHHKIWRKNTLQTFKDIIDTFGDKETLDEVKAEVWSRPNALKGLYKKEGLAIGVIEEAFPESLQKLPLGLLGKALKASEAAFTAFQYRTRADAFDKYVDIAERTGADIEGIGKVANSLTGRGTFGQRAESIATVTNNVFFSPRFLKSNIDLLTAHAFDSNIGAFARQQAAINMLKVVSGVAGILATAAIIAPKSVEFDPRSSDFGKIRIGDTRFDVTGGMSSIIVLAARLITGQSKSTFTGKITDLTSGKFGARTRMDYIYDFMENKLSPAASVIKNLLHGRDFEGKAPTFMGEVYNLLMPLPISNAIETYKNPKSAPMLLAIIADNFGIATNTYSPRKKKPTAKAKIKLAPEQMKLMEEQGMR